MRFHFVNPLDIIRRRVHLGRYTALHCPRGLPAVHGFNLPFIGIRYDLDLDCPPECRCPDPWTQYPHLGISPAPRVLNALPVVSRILDRAK